MIKDGSGQGVIIDFSSVYFSWDNTAHVSFDRADFPTETLQANGQSLSSYSATLPLYNVVSFVILTICALIVVGERKYQEYLEKKKTKDGRRSTNPELTADA